MKRTVFLLAAALVVCSAFAGCQKTPDDPIVVGKNTEDMLEAAEVEETAAAAAGDAAVDLYARLNAPATYTAELTSKAGNLAIHVDAEVVLPEAELPIVRIRQAAFTTEQVERFASALFGENAKYVQGIDTLTKAAYERKIELLRSGIADWETIGQYVFDLQYYTKEEAQGALAELLREAADAPESLPAVTPDFTWREIQAWGAEGRIETADIYLSLWAMPDGATYSNLNVINGLDLRGSAQMFYIRDESSPVGALERNKADVTGLLSISRQDAQALAEATIRAMGLEGFACTARQASLYRFSPLLSKAVYDFAFTRIFGGVEETYTSADQSGGDEYNKPRFYEKAHVLIDDEGVFYVQYNSPCEIVGTVMERTELLPFDQIRAIFEKMVPIVDNIVDTGVWGEDAKMDYVITTVRLGLVSVREQNKDTGLLVPAWDFLGYDRTKAYSEDWVESETNGLRSYLTVNAIDGSIIDRNPGY